MGGAASVGAAAGGEEAGPAYPVVLNVYDLTPLNNYLHWCGLGIFHSAVDVHGSEYSFGAHDHPSSGVFEVEPKSCPGFIYRCSIFIGYTSLNPLEFREFIQRMASEYHGDTYHLISKNCNHFTDDLSIRLTGKPIPGWVNRLARLGAFCNCLLPESMRLESTETKHLADCHLSDGSNTTSNENFEDDDPEDKHLLSTSSVAEDAIVKEVHRRKSAEA